MSITFVSKVAGIPCRVKVTRYEPACPPDTRGHFEDAELGWPSEMEFRLLQVNKGSTPIKWLEKRVTPEDEIRLEQEYLAAIAASHTDI